MSSAYFIASVWRGGAEGDFRDYQVPVREHQTVLDVVTWVQRHADPTLTYRFACRVGMCGACAMSVNGTPRWTCRTHADRVIRDGRVTIAPLANFPVIKDLAADMSGFFGKWREARGSHRPTRDRHEPLPRIRPTSPARRAIDPAIECINCGVCHAACDTVRWNPAYLGPAALNRAWTLASDERDGDRGDRLRAVTGEGGCTACHSHQSCQALCPNGLNPTASIAGLKRLAARALLTGALR